MDGWRIVLQAQCLSSWSFYVLPVHMWVFFRYSSFLTQIGNMHANSTSNYKLPLGVDPEMDMKPFQGV